MPSVVLRANSWFCCLFLQAELEGIEERLWLLEEERKRAFEVEITLIKNTADFLRDYDELIKFSCKV